MLHDEHPRAKVTTPPLPPTSSGISNNCASRPVEKVSTASPASKRWVSRFFLGNGNGGGQGGGGTFGPRILVELGLRCPSEVPSKGIGEGAKD